MTVKISKKGIRLECNNWKNIFVIPVVVKVLAEVILEYIKEHFASFINKDQAGFRFGFS